MKPTVNFYILITIFMKIMIAVIFLMKFAFVKISYKTQNEVLAAILASRHKMLVESLLLGSSTKLLTLLSSH